MFLVEELPPGALPVYDRDPSPQTPPREGVVGVMVPVSDQDVVEEPRAMFSYAAADATLTARLFSRLGLGGPTSEPKPPSPPPMWMVPGVWIRGRENPEMFACIVSIAADRQVTLHNWRRLPEEISLPVSDIERYWEECPRPKEPALRFNRVLDDDFLKDLAPKTATVSIEGKIIGTIRWAGKLIGGVRWPQKPEGHQTRFERIDRDE
jgi:hypothetical protein